MLTFISIAGFTVALIVFLNLLSAGEKGANRSGIGFQAPNRPEQNGAGRILRQAPSQKRPRICPVCGTPLTEKEYLIASIAPELPGQKREAHIYGCPHCFMTDGVNTKLSKMEPW
jgi:hypothetical protein